MRRSSAFFLVVATLAFPVVGRGDEKLVREVWETAYLQGLRSGYSHETTHWVERGGFGYYRTEKTLVLNGRRFNTLIQLRMDVGDVETKDGKVLGVSMRQYLGRDKKLEIRGKVQGKKIKLEGPKGITDAPWDDRALGMYRQARFFRDKKIKPGDKHEFLTFEPSINLVIKMTVVAKAYEEIAVPGAGGKIKCLRIEITPQRIQGVQLPTMTMWLDSKYEPLRSEVLLPGLGLLTLVRSSKAEALRPVRHSELPDFGFGQLVRVNRRLSRPYDVVEATYAIRIKGEESPETAIAQDLRQQVLRRDGDRIVLRVTAGPVAKADKVGKEFLQSSYFITSDDAKVRQLAERAVGTETDPWKKALRIESWVHRNMEGRNHEAMAPASHVAKTLQGDCSEFAMLTAAMCRAQGIPSRTAIGLIYANTPRGPAFSYHMWTEVFVDKQWMPLDATLGRGFVGGTHIKITDHSWHNTRSLTPMLPLLRVLGKISIDVLQVRTR